MSSYHCRTPFGAENTIPRLPQSFYRRSGPEVARELIGQILCRRVAEGLILRGRIVEVEAYDGFADRASHAFRGTTARNRVMFGPGGRTYVYLIYGMHHCLNVVCGDAGTPSAVLIRAAEGPTRTDSASGPGRLCRAFRIDRGDDGVSLSGRSIWIESATPVAEREVGQTRRIGVDYAGWWARRRWRWVIRNHPARSGPRSWI